MKKYKVLFTNLDGVIINTISGESLPKGIWDMKFKFDVLDAIKRLEPEYMFIVSNQDGMRMGNVTTDHFNRKMKYVFAVIDEYCKDITIDGLYCGTNDKKDYRHMPNVGMLFYLIGKYYHTAILDKSDMLMIGNADASDIDKNTAENFGIGYMDVNEFVKTYGGD